MIDAWLRVCLVGSDLITVEARVVLALDKRCTPHELEAAVTALLAEKTHR